jgi:UDP-N-acetylmuramoyl-tripeptide--D-alanyl-D-alanine ligase
MNIILFRRKVGTLLWQCKLRLLYVAAYVWRHLLLRTTFIAITGSVGKTTTKECVAAVLAVRYPTAKTLYNQNDYYGAPRSLLRVRPWHRFAVIETGADQPGMMRRAARLVRPHIAVILTVARTHTNVFRTLDETAAEKTHLLTGLTSNGIAILNADDPRVRGMADGYRGPVKWFGRSAGLDLWAEEVSSQWPARLSVRVRTASTTQRVQTNLVGEHWGNSILAAMLVAETCGIALPEAAAALERVQPFMGRMQPIRLPNGATILRDEHNGSPDTLEAALRVLTEARARRKVLVLGSISDSREKSRVRFRRLGQQAAQVADLAIFVGEHGHHAVKAAIATGLAKDQVREFVTPAQTAVYLKTELRSGDLVLIKGRATEHLSRIVFAQFGQIGCWTTFCRKRISCDTCDQLRPEFDLRALSPLGADLQTAPTSTAKRPTVKNAGAETYAQRD